MVSTPADNSFLQLFDYRDTGTRLVSSVRGVVNQLSQPGRLQMLISSLLVALWRIHRNTATTQKGFRKFCSRTEGEDEMSLGATNHIAGTANVPKPLVRNAPPRG
jgi:hypothetical protein